MFTVYSVVTHSLVYEPHCTMLTVTHLLHTPTAAVQQENELLSSYLKALMEATALPPPRPPRSTPHLCVDTSLPSVHTAMYGCTASSPRMSLSSNPIIAMVRTSYNVHLAIEPQKTQPLRDTAGVTLPSHLLCGDTALLTQGLCVIWPISAPGTALPSRNFCPAS